MGPTALALALMVLQSAAGTLDVADVARAYARRTDFGDGALLDLENTPRVGVGLEWPTTTFALDYAPRFLWVDVLGPGPSPTLLLHSAALELSWHRPRYTLSLSQTAAIGDQDFNQVGAAGLALAPGQTSGAVAPTVPGAAPAMPGTMTPTGEPIMPTDLDLVPAATVVSVAAAQTTASLRHDWSRRLASELRATFAITGGADAEAQQFLPQQRTAQLDASLDFRRSRRDDLGTDLRVAQIHTSNGFDHWVTSLMERWAMHWGPSSGGELGAGAALQDSTGPTGLQTTEWMPIGTATAWYELLLHAARARLQWDIGYRPDVDALAGTLQSRLFTTAQAGLIIDRSTVRLVLGAAQTIPRDAPDATQVLSADLVFEHRLRDWLDLQLGGQLLRQELGSSTTVPAPSGSRWLLYAGLEARAPEVLF